MALRKSKLYATLLVLCLTGYAWLYFNIEKSLVKSTKVCLINYLANIPCFSCGSTRSVISLAKGNFVKAISINPMGVLIAVIMLFAPVWIILDIITKKSTLFYFYQKAEAFIAKPKHAILLIFIVVINWIWNIQKKL
ncbi:MAG: DUF2752 domain-containing protein [Tenacibaculum sp.]